MEIDDSDFGCLGIPTPLEMWKHQCTLLATEIEENHAELRRARSNIAQLVAMNCEVTAERDKLKKELSSTALKLSDAYRELSMTQNQLYTYRGQAARLAAADTPVPTAARDDVANR